MFIYIVGVMEKKHIISLYVLVLVNLALADFSFSSYLISSNPLLTKSQKELACGLLFNHLSFFHMNSVGRH